MSKTSLTRDYKASIERVWEALTTPEQIMQFWAPPGMQTASATIDKLEVGGIFIYSMKSPEGHQMWVRCRYTVVDKPNKLAFMETPADEDGNPVPPSAMGMPGDEIKESLTEIELKEVDGMTKLTMSFDYGDSKSNEFASGGWKGMLENLESVVG